MSNPNTNLGVKQDYYHQNNAGYDKEKEGHQNLRPSPRGQGMAYANPLYPQKKEMGQNQYVNVPSHPPTQNFPQGMAIRPNINEMYQGHPVPMNEYHFQNQGNNPPYMAKGSPDKVIYQNVPHLPNTVPHPPNLKYGGKEPQLNNKEGMQNLQGMYNKNDALYSHAVPTQGAPSPPYNDLNLQRQKSEDQKQQILNKNPNNIYQENQIHKHFSEHTGMNKQNQPSMIQGIGNPGKPKHYSEIAGKPPFQKQNNFQSPPENKMGMPNQVQNLIPMMEAKKIKPYSNIPNINPQNQTENRQSNFSSGNLPQYPQQYSQGNTAQGIPVPMNDAQIRQFQINDQQNMNQNVNSNQAQVDQNMKFINQNQQLMAKNNGIHDDALKASNTFKNNMYNVDSNNNEILKRPLTPNRMQGNIFAFQDGNACQNPNMIINSPNIYQNLNYYQKKYPSIIIHNTSNQKFEMAKGMTYDQLFEKAFGPNYIATNKPPKNKNLQQNSLPQHPNNIPQNVTNYRPVNIVPVPQHQNSVIGNPRAPYYNNPRPVYRPSYI